MVTLEQARRLALSLDGAIEQDHHGRPSFRVAGRIFATVPDQEHMNVMLEEDGIHTAVQGEPEVCEEVWWGKRLRAVSVSLQHATESLLVELLSDAWMSKS